jgi:5-methylcytosine-specific restriction enzyme A
MGLKMLKPGLKTLDTRRATTPVVKRASYRKRERMRQEVFLRDLYMCCECRKAGKMITADVVDHVVPLFMGGADAPSNLQSLCHEHHDAKTAAEAKER